MAIAHIQSAPYHGYAGYAYEAHGLLQVPEL